MTFMLNRISLISLLFLTSLAFGQGDTTTAILGLTKPGHLSHVGNWDSVYNTDFDIIDSTYPLTTCVRVAWDGIAHKFTCLPAVVEGDVTNLVPDLALKAPLASPSLTGIPTAPTPAALDNSTKLATTAYDDSAVSIEKVRALAAEATKAALVHTHIESDVTNLVSDIALKASLASPALTGAPTAPTATALDNSTKIATTAFVQAATIPLPTASAAGQIPASTGAGTSYAAQTKPVLDLRDFAGANAGAQLQAAHDSASCPSSGCIIDARGLGATDTIAGLNITKPIKVYLGSTTFSVSASMVFTNVAGPVFEGAGPNITYFNWTGNNSTPMFRLISVQNATFRGFNLNASTGVPLTEFFTSERGATGNPTNNAFYDIVMSGTDGGVVDGFKWVTGAGGDAGNDTFSFTRVDISNYSHAAWNSSGQTQSQGHTFHNCESASNGYGQYGYYGVGSFAMYSMQFSANSAADVFITNLNNGVLIDGGLSIGSNRLYAESSRTASPMPVRILGVNFASTGLNADGKVMILFNRGPYLIENNQVGTSQSVPAQFFIDPSGTAGNWLAIGNSIFTNLSNPFTAVNSTVAWQLTGNNINTVTVIPDQFPNGMLFAPDNTYDIGESGDIRPRTGYFGTSVVAPVYQTTLSTPANSSATCTAGQMWADSGFVYVCTASNTVKRAALSTF